MLIVRQAEPQDAEAVAGVHVRSWQAAYRGLLPDDYLDGLRPSDRAARYTFGRKGPEAPETLVLVADGLISGFATLGPSRDGDAAAAGELYALYLDPRAWGRGMGRTLMAAARARLHGRGFAVGILWVLTGNHRARRFYCADGWQPDGHARCAQVWGASVDEVRYRRPLP